MCGIIGIVSNKNVVSDIIHSLKKLEYRGYDSAGVATITKGEIIENKCAGKVEDLEKLIGKTLLNGTTVIGHVRWATHGIPNQINAHPHSSDDVSVVHNGIIENSNFIKKELIKKGYTFKSQTDTEVVTHLITENLKKFNYLEAVFETLKELKGSFALGIIFKKFDNLIVGARRGSPLAVGYSKDEKYIGSDSYALNSMTKEISYLDDGDVCVVTKEKIEFYNHHKKKVEKKVHKIADEEVAYNKGNYKDFMSKEIDQQPEVIKKSINEYVDKIRKEINITNFPIDPQNINRIILIACGTAYHACVVAKYWFEEFTNLEVVVDIASEFRYRKNQFRKNDFYIFISQSGETADTIAAQNLCKANKAINCAIVNVAESSLSREADMVLPIHVGPEVGVASTKAFTGQILVALLLILKIAKLRKEISDKDYNEVITGLENIADQVSTILKHNKDAIEEIAPDLTNIKGSIFLGRGISYPVALEGALKFKELTYLHAEGYPAGEMKHGPLALIENGMPVIVVAPHDQLYEKSVSNMQEVIARGGKIILVTDREDEEYSGDNIWFQINVPKTNRFLTPFLTNIPLQLLAYFVALKKGNDIDKPRNLAKSVTVE